jgi:tetratricopeptide (TPR) repeat protein
MRIESTSARALCSTGSRGRGLLPAAALTCVLLLATPVATLAQDEDLNVRYAFPASLGVEYQMLTPFASEAAGFTAFDVGVSVRIPLPRMPRLQPLIRGGIMQFTDDEAGTKDWTHTHYYGGLGVAWANRIDRTFELAADLTVGVSEAVFPNLAPEVGSIGSLNGYAEIGGHICLDPSYSFSIDIHPNLKWLQSFSAMQEFNGPVFGIGFAVSYRFGEDPDSAAAIVRSLRFSSLEFPDAFAALRSYYATNPIGSVIIENSDPQEITDLEISFEQKGFMEAPTPCAQIPILAPGETATIELFASYNADVFTTEGTIPMVGEIIASYTSRGRPVEQRSSVSYVLRDKTNMTWSDDAKVAAFITHEDSALRNYASWIRQSCKASTVSGLSPPLQTAMAVYEALGTYGVIYQTDPSKPAFEEVQGNPVVIDSVSLPRDTLQRTTGDCDDLTVLYCSLLEAVGIDTAFITVPGHIFTAFSTGVDTQDYRQVHPDRAMTLDIDGKLWVPVEITMIGTQGFMNAWRTGIDEYTQAPSTRRAFILTAQAQSTYWPVGLQQTDLGLQYGSSEAVAVADAFDEQLRRLGDVIVGDYRERVDETGRKQDLNRLGIAYSRIERFDPATDAFEQALGIDPDYLAARTNLANIAFLQDDIETSLHQYNEIYAQMAASGNANSTLAASVLLNISRAQYELEEFDDARETFDRAEEIDESVTAAFAYISTAAGGEGRAAEQTGPQILFVGDEE